MYNPMEPAPSPVSAWVEAARRLKADGDLHGLMLHIDDPIGFLPGEEEVIRTVDAFLRDHDKCGVSTVSNTIFPAALDRGDGIEALTERYMQVYERRMHRQGEWGRYFQRGRLAETQRHGQRKSALRKYRNAPSDEKRRGEILRKRD